MENIKVSVIIPVFNNQNQISKCIESVALQTYRNIEIICVDDGSEDDSLVILRELKKQDNRIKVLHQNNMGVSIARNQGMMQSTGDYFMFLDADDYIEKETIYKLVLEALKTDADIITASYACEREGKKINVRNKGYVPEKKIIETRKFLKYIYHRDYYKAVGGYCVGKLYKSNVFKKDDRWTVLFQDDLTNCEDVLFLGQCMMVAKTIVYINEPLYIYVFNEKSKTHDYMFSATHMSAIDAYARLIELFKGYNISPIIMLFVKRFYTYRAILIANHANISEYHKNDTRIYEELIKYKLYYIAGNITNPRRIYSYLLLCQEYKEKAYVS